MPRTTVPNYSYSKRTKEKNNISYTRYEMVIGSEFITEQFPQRFI